ncbi:MAG: hypothetical protein LBR00_03055 [Clostridiales Family XIII bacterium]|jgi:hypothetical protein|nr:hypothetical protein [Clostridiales Family XIII bacterium]
MTAFKLKLNRQAVRSELLKSDGARQIVARLASEAAARASSMGGERYESAVYAGKNRIYGTVRAADNAAAAENARHNTLAKAIGGKG